ncbi:hypothetical protein HU200_041317 [Digitaria exilis]|uniref:Uncharacterized protein n=1 Tax=Digitaria exilis TaxID=1010633 RepID=A0A835BIP1_9POAL|nr:hypothetical protein HU200_041317 [Digitaria exilis]
MLTDLEEDRHMGYSKPIPTSTDLCVFYLVDMEGVVCPVCPVCLWKSYQWEAREVMMEHVTGVATSNLWRKFHRKLWSRQRVVAQNVGRMGHRVRHDSWFSHAP